jgi:hypothetical protein
MRVHRVSLKLRHLSIFENREEETQDGGVADGFFAGKGKALNLSNTEPGESWDPNQRRGMRGLFPTPRG